MVLEKVATEGESFLGTQEHTAFPNTDFHATERLFGFFLFHYEFCFADLFLLSLFFLDNAEVNIVLGCDRIEVIVPYSHKYILDYVYVYECALCTRAKSTAFRTHCTSILQHWVEGT